MAHVTWNKNTTFKKTLLIPVNRIVKINKNLVSEFSNYYTKNVNDIVMQKKRNELLINSYWPKKLLGNFSTTQFSNVRKKSIYIFLASFALTFAICSWNSQSFKTSSEKVTLTYNFWKPPIMETPYHLVETHYHLWKPFSKNKACLSKINSVFGV